ncbi:hypothetical protein [Actinacidiphila sp. bgisy160]|uniref:hypothetical protein n=1 Tax=Actinacidiphila sp. bgisy160 TaxID=3413796 RepID=UPI003D738773
MDGQELQKIARDHTAELPGTDQEHRCVSAYVGGGTQRWPAVNRLDAVPLFRTALEDAAPGTVLHAVADEGDTMRSLAEAIGGVLGVPVESAPPERFGLIGRLFALDMPSSSALTRERFGWDTHPSLIDDLVVGGYPALG